MRLKGYSPRTIKSYVNMVAAYARHVGKSPELTDCEDARAFMVYLVEERKCSTSHLHRYSPSRTTPPCAGATGPIPRIRPCRDGTANGKALLPALWLKRPDHSGGLASQSVQGQHAAANGKGPAGTACLGAQLMN